MTFDRETCAYDFVGDLKPPFASGCRHCALRAMASGPAYASSSRLQLLVPAYRRALEATFPGEEVRAVHAEVKAVSERSNRSRAEVPQ